MAVCDWCGQEMTSAASCGIDVLHQDGRPIPMVSYGPGLGRRSRRDRCGDCGVARDGFHHLGCDLQVCPVCGGQMLSCGCLFDEDLLDVGGSGGTPMGVDAAGGMVERMWLGDQEIVVHYVDIPESDITTHNGMRITTALRTVIDLAADVDEAHLIEMVTDSLERRLFTEEEARLRLAQPDMATHAGAERLRQVLPG